MSRVKKAGEWSGDLQLDGLLQRARWLRSQSRRFDAALPPELSGHCQLANVRGELLVVLVDSPVWATRLRLLGPSLLFALKQHDAFSRCSRIEAKVDHVRPILSTLAVIKPALRPGSLSASAQISELKSMLLERKKEREAESEG
ncbi:MAG: DUF721 domain-containing protein [Gammaproteobacteria bacterium]|nr:DUF721 domain-containing protein [Gammaproteobacteria bacterium]